MQGGGDGFVGKAGDGLTVIVKNDLFSPVKIQDRMFFQSHTDLLLI
jgi:hypothetical protein